MDNIDCKYIEIVAKKTLCWPPKRKWKSKDSDQRIRAFFSAPSLIIADLWNQIWNRLGSDKKDEVCKKGSPQCQYLLYALLFLKVYATEEVHCSIVG